MAKKAALFVFLLVILLAQVVIADDLASLKEQYAAQKTVSERAHQVWLDCLDCYVKGGDGCPLCVPLEEADMAEARKLDALESALSEAEAAEEERKAASPPAQTIPATSSGSGVQQAGSDLSSKSVDELNALHIQIHNEWSATLYDPSTYDRSAFDNAMKTVWDMRTKELDDSLSRSNACYDACSGEKFQRGGGGQSCVQPCLDRAYTEGKRVTSEIERLEKAAYIDDINRLQAALGKNAQEVKGELPKGPKEDRDTDRGLTPQGLIAPSMGGYLGNAYVERPDGTKVIPGKELYLKVDDKVITGEESKVNIMFGNAGKMHLGPNTELRVGSALLDQYYLAKGTLKTTLEGQKLEIRTPTASIFNKGTEFITEYNATTNITKVLLYEGELEISSEKETIVLTARNYCTISPDGTITSGPLDFAEWNAMGSSFYEERSDKDVMAIYAWITFAVLVISATVAMIFFYREKKRAKEGHKKDAHTGNLGGFSILFGTLSILACLFPIIGFPFAFTSTTLARIQKLRSPTTSAKIGHMIGSIGAVLNGIALFAFFSYIGMI